MANEISITVGMACTKDELVIKESTTTVRRDMAGTHAASIVQDIGTTYEALDIPAELATLGYCYLKNVDATNYIEIGRDVGAAFYGVIRLKPGDIALVRFSAATMYGRANTATAKLRFSLLEE